MKITPKIAINTAELVLTFVTSSGPGGQNVNKVATAAQLRFNVLQSRSLPQEVRERLIAQLGKRLTTQGELIIKGDRFRTQERNKQDVFKRLSIIIKQAAYPPKKRKKTKPGKAVIEKRLTKKKQLGEKKARRQRVFD